MTIPCSFEIEDQYESNLDDTCRAIWKLGWEKVVFNSKDPQTSLNKGELTGDLTKKNCTTTLNNIQPAGSNSYFFRLECGNGLKYSFASQKFLLSVKGIKVCLSTFHSLIDLTDMTLLCLFNLANSEQNVEVTL